MSIGANQPHQTPAPLFFHPQPHLLHPPLIISQRSETAETMAGRGAAAKKDIAWRPSHRHRTWYVHSICPSHCVYTHCTSRHMLPFTNLWPSTLPYSCNMETIAYIVADFQVVLHINTSFFASCSSMLHTLLLAPILMYVSVTIPKSNFVLYKPNNTICTSLLTHNAFFGLYCSNHTHPLNNHYI